MFGWDVFCGGACNTSQSVGLEWGGMWWTVSHTVPPPFSGLSMANGAT